MKTDLSSIHHAPLEQLIQWWAQPLKTLGELGEDGSLDEIAYGLTLHQDGIRLLKRSLYDDTYRSDAALYFLSWPDTFDAEVQTALMSAFESSNERTKYTALWGFINAECFALSELQLSGCRDSDNDRLAALAMVYRCRWKSEQRIGLLRDALQSSNPRTREYACDEIGDFQLSELANDLTGLLDDDDADVVSAAECNLEFFD